MKQYIARLSDSIVNGRHTFDSGVSIMIKIRSLERCIPHDIIAGHKDELELRISNDVWAALTMDGKYDNDTCCGYPVTVDDNSTCEIEIRKKVI